MDRRCGVVVELVLLNQRPAYDGEISAEDPSITMPSRPELTSAAFEVALGHRRGLSTASSRSPSATVADPFVLNLGLARRRSRNGQFWHEHAEPNSNLNRTGRPTRVISPWITADWRHRSDFDDLVKLVGHPRSRHKWEPSGSASASRISERNTEAGVRSRFDRSGQWGSGGVLSNAGSWASARIAYGTGTSEFGQEPDEVDELSRGSSVPTNPFGINEPPFLLSSIAERRDRLAALQGHL